MENCKLPERRTWQLMQKCVHKERDIGAPLHNKKLTLNLGHCFKDLNTTNIRKFELPLPMSSLIICSRSFPKLTLRSPEAYIDKTSEWGQFYYKQKNHVT